MGVGPPPQHGCGSHQCMEVGHRLQRGCGSDFLPMRMGVNHRLRTVVLVSNQQRDLCPHLEVWCSPGRYSMCGFMDSQHIKGVWGCVSPKLGHGCKHQSSPVAWV